MTIQDDIRKYVADADDAVSAIEELRRTLFEESPLKAMPIDFVRWVPVEQVEANDYNPNSVARHEMRLLFISIDHDGYTQPVVTVYDAERDKYVIELGCGHAVNTVDGGSFHRWTHSAIPNFPTSPSSVTRLVSLTAKEASLRSPSSVKAGSSTSGFKSANRKATTAKTSANGSKTHGKQDGSTDKAASASPTSGTCTESTTSTGSSGLVCPICASSELEPGSYWTSWQAVLPTGEECGPLLSWLTSETTPDRDVTGTQSPDNSADPQKALAMHSENFDVRVTSKPTFVIIDGFHRYFTLKSSEVLMERTGGRLPIVVLDKGIKDRMASTVRHNRARGEHSIKGMSSMVFSLLEEGWSDAEVCNELGLEPEELIRLKHITGFSKLFADVEYRKAWVTNRQIRFAHDAQAELV